MTPVGLCFGALAGLFAAGLFYALGTIKLRYLDSERGRRRNAYPSEEYEVSRNLSRMLIWGGALFLLISVIQMVLALVLWLTY